jgi:hypothetical protein
MIKGDPMKMSARLLLLSLFFIVFSAGIAFAGWSEPVEVIIGSWGTGTGQFGLRSEGGFYVAPSIEAVTKDQSVIITDPANKKQLVFNGKGKLVEEVQWGDAKARSGSICAPLSQRDRGAVTVYPQKIGANLYRITIVFPERNVDVDSDTDFKIATRDAAGFIYGLGAGAVVRFDPAGKKAGDLPLPRAHEELIPDPARRTQRGVYIEYGEPVVATNGDVYLWQKSDANYSVLKWTWK